MVTKTEDTKRVDRLVEEAFNNGELGVIDEVVASDYVFKGPAASAMPQEIHGPEGFKELVRMWRSAFPDFQMEVEERFVDGDTIIDHFEAQGTHEGEFMGIEPTGKEVEITTIGIHHMEDGKCVADYVVTDTFGLMQQLGVVEPPGE